MKKIHDILKTHPFFKEFSEEDLLFLSCCAQNKVFKEGEIIARENAPANQFYLIRSGQVAISMSIPHRENQILETIGEGDIFGWSWLFAPYRWMFQASALKTTHAIALDGKCLRERLESNPELGYKVLKQFSHMMMHRLHAARLQLLDIYG